MGREAMTQGTRGRRARAVQAEQDQLANTASTGGRMPLVLMYHSVTPYTEDPYLVTVSPDRFEQQMRWLRRRGLRGTSVRELLAAHSLGMADDLIGLTFDDGYADFIQYALPILRRHGFSATVYVIAGRLGGLNDWDPQGPRKPLMTAPQVRAIADEGIEIGSHGLHHVRLPEASETRLADEVRLSRAIIQDTVGSDVAGFCYPYGDVSAHVVDAVRGAGYDYGCGIKPSDLTSRHALPRTYIGDADHSLRLRAKWLRHDLTWREHWLSSGRARRPKLSGNGAATASVVRPTVNPG